MLNRTAMLGLSIVGLFFAAPVTHSLAESPAAATVRLVRLDADDDGAKKDKDEDKKDIDDDKKGEEHEDRDEHKEKKIEQAVPMNMIPQAVLDAVKKEVPNGTITEAELEAKRGKIMYSFDVKTSDMAYEVKITVDGKFFSKKVDDDDDEKDDKKIKPAPADKM